MRLIDADKIGLTDFEIIQCDGDYKRGLALLIEKLNTAPTIEAEPNSCEYWDSESHFCALRRPQAEPRKHGRWIPCTKTGMPLTEYGRCHGEKWFGYKCSECNAIYKGNALTESPYCQRCGAKMDEVE